MCRCDTTRRARQGECHCGQCYFHSSLPSLQVVSRYSCAIGESSRVDVIELCAWLAAFGVPLQDFVSRLASRLNRNGRLPSIKRGREPTGS